MLKCLTRLFSCTSLLIAFSSLSMRIFFVFVLFSMRFASSETVASKTPLSPSPSSAAEVKLTPLQHEELLRYLLSMGVADLESDLGLSSKNRLLSGHCDAYAKNPIQKPLHFDPSKTNDFQYAKTIVDWFWRQLVESGGMRQALSPRPVDVRTHNREQIRRSEAEWALVDTKGKGHSTVRKRILAMYFFSGANASSLPKELSLYRGVSQMDFEFFASLSDEAAYPVLAKAILQKLNAPFDGRTLLPSEKKSMSTAALGSVRQMAILEQRLEAHKKEAQDKGESPSSSELKKFCEEYLQLAAGIQKDRLTTMVSAISKSHGGEEKSPPFMDQPQVMQYQNEDGSVKEISITPNQYNELNECVERSRNAAEERAELLAKKPEYKDYFSGRFSPDYELHSLTQSSATETEFMQQFLNYKKAVESDGAEKDFDLSRVELADFMPVNLDLSKVTSEEKKLLHQQEAHLMSQALSIPNVFIMLNNHLKFLNGGADKPFADSDVIVAALRKFASDKSPGNIDNAKFLMSLNDHLLKYSVPGIKETDNYQLKIYKIKQHFSDEAPANAEQLKNELVKLMRDFSNSKALPATPKQASFQAHVKNLKSFSSEVKKARDALEGFLEQCSKSIAMKGGLSEDDANYVFAKDLLASHLQIEGAQMKEAIVSGKKPAPSSLLSHFMHLDHMDNGILYNPQSPTLSVLGTVSAIDDLGQYARKEIGVGILSESDAENAESLYDLSQVPLLGKTISSNSQSPQYQEALVDFFSAEKFHYLSMLYREKSQEFTSLCMKYYSLLSPENKLRVSPRAKSVCDMDGIELPPDADPKQVEAHLASLEEQKRQMRIGHLFVSGNRVIVPSAFDPEIDRLKREADELKLKAYNDLTEEQKRPPHSNDYHSFAQIPSYQDNLFEQAELKEKEILERERKLESKAPRILSFSDYQKELDKVEVEAQGIFKKYQDKYMELSPFGCGQGDAFGRVVVAIASFGLAPATFAAHGEKYWNPAVDGDDKCFKKVMRLADEFKNEYARFAYKIRMQFGLSEKHPDFQRVTASAMQGFEIFKDKNLDANGNEVKDPNADPESVKNKTGPKWDIESGRKGVYVEAGMSAALFGVGFGANMVKAVATRGYWVARANSATASVASRMYARRQLANMAYQGGFKTAYAEAGRAGGSLSRVAQSRFFDAPLFWSNAARQGAVSSAFGTVMVGSAGRVLPVGASRLSQELQMLVTGRPTKEKMSFFEANKGYVQGMMIDPWGHFKQQAVYQAFTPAFISLEARINKAGFTLATSPKYHQAIGSVTGAAQKLGVSLHPRLVQMATTTLPIKTVTTASNAVSGIPVDVAIAYGDYWITKSPQKHEEAMKGLQARSEEVSKQEAMLRAEYEKLLARARELDAKHGAGASKSMAYKLEVAKKNYQAAATAVIETQHELEIESWQPLATIWTGVTNGGVMAHLPKIGDPAEKTMHMMMGYRQYDTADKAKAALGIGSGENITSIADLAARTQAKLKEMGDEIRWAPSDSATKVEAMLRVMGAHRRMLEEIMQAQRNSP